MNKVPILPSIGQTDLSRWESEGGANPLHCQDEAPGIPHIRLRTMTCVEMLRTVGSPDDGHCYPKFRNDRGVTEIRIGAKTFECIGETPPQDHPHVFLEMGKLEQILCPYCSTLYRFDSGFAASESNPADSQFRR